MFKLISLTVKESIKLFYNKYWIQTDGVTMSSFLGITLTNVFLYYHESDFLKICAKDFNPVYYSRYVDNIYIFFLINQNMGNFFKYINRKQKNMKLLIDTKTNGSLSFLDIEIFRGNEKFVIGVFREVRLVGCILISIALFHLSTSLVLYTHYWIGVFIYLLNSDIYLLSSK